MASTMAFRWHSVGIGFALMLALYVFTGCWSTGRSAVSISSGETPTGADKSLTILAPTSVRAGTPVTVTVIGDPAAAGQGIQLFLSNTNGTTLFTAGQLGDKAIFLLDSALTQTAGQATLIAQSGEAHATFSLAIVARDAVEPLLALVGPRSITADGDHWTMLTALPNDQFGNAVADGTLVIVRVLYPTDVQATQAVGRDAIEVLTTETTHLVASLRIDSRIKAGRIDMAATSGNAHSAERTVLAVPGAPVAFGLIAETRQGNADGRHLVTVATEPLVDRYGNQLLDGTAVTFLVTNPDGTTRTLPAQSIDGKATVQLQAPTVAGSLQIEALLLNTTSRILTLEFAAGIGIAPIPLRVTPTAELLTLVAGPMLGPLGQYIPDGTEVRFTVRPAGIGEFAQELTVPAVAGFATAVIRRNLLATGHYTVHVTAGAGEGSITIDLP